MTRKSKVSLYSRFFEHMRDSGCHLLRDDVKFICNQLTKIPSERHREALRGYFAEWQLGEGLEEKSQHKQNTGRRRANLYLLSLGVAQNKKDYPP